MIPPEHLGPFKSFINNYMTSKMSFNPAAPKQDTFNSAAVINSIGTNETGGVKSDPYSFMQPSGSKKQGNALGKYQVTEGELSTYGKQFGVPVDSKTFLSNPGLQDTYMKNKVDYLRSNFNWTPEQIMAAHRGGFGKPDKIQAQMDKHSGYVKAGMNVYNKLASNQ